MDGEREFPCAQSTEIYLPLRGAGLKPTGEAGVKGSAGNRPFFFGRDAVQFQWLTEQDGEY